MQLLDRLISKGSKVEAVNKRKIISDNYDSILKAIDLGYSHNEIIEDFAKDGYFFTYNYFSELLSLERKKRNKKDDSGSDFKESKTEEKTKFVAKKNQTMKEFRENNKEFIKKLMNSNPLSDKNKSI